MIKTIQLFYIQYKGLKMVPKTFDQNVWDIKRSLMVCATSDNYLG